MPAIDYRPLVSAHYDAKETVISTGLQDAKGSEHFLTGTGTDPASVSDGALGLARGPCAGFFNTGTGFQKTPVAGTVWDTRQGAPGNLTKFTLMGWGRLQAGHGATQEFLSIARLAGPANSRAFILRGVQFLGPGLEEGPVFLGWDGSAFTLSTAFNWTTPIPHNEWYFMGVSLDFSVPGNGKFVGYVRVPSIGSGSITIDPIPVNIMSHTALDQNLIVGMDSGHSSGGAGFEVDHITWMKGYAFADAIEFGLFSAAPVPYPFGFDMSAGIPTPAEADSSAFHYYHGRI